MASRQQLIDFGGHVPRLGADIDSVTLTHLAEYRADVHNKRWFLRRYGRADIGGQWIDALGDSNGIAGAGDSDYFEAVLSDFVASGDARVGRVGGCTDEFSEGAAFVECATHCAALCAKILRTNWAAHMPRA